MKKVLLLAAMLLMAGPDIHAAPAKTKYPVVTPVPAAALKKAIAARKGKVVLVNFWATWCVPCVEELPALVKLQKRYASKGLSVLFVSADDPRTQKTKVAPFLARHGVTAPSWIIKGNTADFIAQFDPKIEGAFALPRTYVYDRKGRRVKVFSEDKNYTEFEKLVKPLL